MGSGRVFLGVLVFFGRVRSRVMDGRVFFSCFSRFEDFEILVSLRVEFRNSILKVVYD